MTGEKNASSRRAVAKMIVGLGGAEAAERRVEEQDPEADDRHRPGAQEVVASIGEVVPEVNPACWRAHMNARLNSPSARMAMAWP